MRDGVLSHDPLAFLQSDRHIWDLNYLSSSDEEVIESSAEEDSESEEGEEHGNSVDIISASRSTGSILKPFLFAGMIDNGTILQTTIVPDVPIRYNGYAPKNYNRKYCCTNN